MIRVPRVAVEDVLDRLLLIVPEGVREIHRGRHVELVMRGDDLPLAAELERAVGRWSHRIEEGEVSDDWRERRLVDYSPDVIRGRLVVRPEWAPAVSPGDDPIEIVLGETSAFGGGTHPTTRTCLEVLLEIPPDGAFADLGCGSGVLAILAARLGWQPVAAVDVQPASVEAARQNAERNRVAIDAGVADLTAEPPPPADGFAANVPPAIHAALARSWAGRPPRVGLLSGFGPDEASDVAAAYRASGLRQLHRFDVHGWTVLVVEG